jgi:hypothetical protein
MPRAKLKSFIRECWLNSFVAVLCACWILVRVCSTDFLASFTCDTCVTFRTTDLLCIIIYNSYSPSAGWKYKLKSTWLQESWNITLCSPVKVIRALPCTVLLFAWFMLVSCLVYSSTLKMEATCSSVTSVDFRRITWHYIPEERTLDNHSWANLKSYSSNTRKIE